MGNIAIISPKRWTSVARLAFERKQSAPFRHQRQPVGGEQMRLASGNVTAVEHDPTGPGLDQADDRGQQGGLSRPVRTHDGDDLASADGERSTEQHGRVAVTGGDILDGQKGCAHAALCRPI